MEKRADPRRIVAVGVQHMPHKSIDLGRGRMKTLERARVEVSVILDNGDVERFAVIRTPTPGVRTSTKVDLARQGFEPIVGMLWADVQRVALRFQFLPLGVPWGIRYSGQPRWFSCFCRGATQVEKPDWRLYQEGKTITIQCTHCTLTQQVSK